MQRSEIQAIIEAYQGLKKEYIKVIKKLWYQSENKQRQINNLKKERDMLKKELRQYQLKDMVGTNTTTLIEIKKYAHDQIMDDAKNNKISEQLNLQNDLNRIEKYSRLF